jgi:hypothetical protein
MIRFPLLLLVLLSAGCASTKPKSPERGSRPTPEVMQSVLSATLAPAHYGMAIYRSPEGPVFTDSNRVHPGQEDVLAFARPAMPVPLVIWETTSSQKIPVLLDTRSPRTWVEFLTAQALGFRPVGPTPFSTRARHLVDDTEGYLALRPSLDFGAIRLENALWQVRPQHLTLGPLGRGLTAPEPLVVLGLDTLKSFAQVRFNFAEHGVGYATDLPYRPNKLNLLASLPFTLTPEGLAVDGAVDDYRGPVLIDTGGHYEVAMKLTETSPARLRQVTLGDFVRRQVAVNDAEFLGFGSAPKPSVGALFFDGLVLTLDFVSSKLYLEAPSSSTP